MIFGNNLPIAWTLCRIFALHKTRIVLNMVIVKACQSNDLLNWQSSNLMEDVAMRGSIITSSIPDSFHPFFGRKTAEASPKNKQRKTQNKNRGELCGKGGVGKVNLSRPVEVFNMAAKKNAAQNSPHPKNSREKSRPR